MINENRYSYITDLPSPSLTQKKALEKLTLRRDRGRQQKAQRHFETNFQPIKRANQSIVFFLVGYLLL